MEATVFQSGSEGLENSHVEMLDPLQGMVPALALTDLTAEDTAREPTL